MSQQTTAPAPARAAVEFVAALPEPSRGPARTPWGADEAAQLRANPGKWAIIARVPDARLNRRAAAKVTARAGTIKGGKTSPWSDQDGAFQAAARTVDGEARLYARYEPHPAPVFSSHALVA